MTQAVSDPERRSFKWFFVVGAPLAWASQLGLGWLVSTASCPSQSAAAMLGPHAARAVELAISVVALVIAVWCMLEGALQRGSTGETLLSVPDRRSFLASVSFIVGLVMIFAIIWAGLASAMLPICERGR